MFLNISEAVVWANSSHKVISSCLKIPFFSIVVVHPKSPHFPFALELTLAGRHSENSTQVQSVIENNANSILAYVVGHRLFAERGARFVQAFNGDRNCQEELCVDHASLEVWETFELQVGLGVLKLAQRHRQLAGEAAAFLSLCRKDWASNRSGVH